MQLTPVIGYAPDADPTTPGVLTECTNLVPTVRGMAQLGAFTTVAPNTPMPTAPPRGGFVAEYLTGNCDVYAGTSAKLYQGGASSWFDVSRVGGYTLGASDQWTFAMLGNTPLAATPSCKIQRYSAGTFADVADAPQAKCIASASGFVVAFNTEDATYGVSPDRWWCCAQLDETSWTPALASQATTGRLVDSPGPILAAAPLGDQIVAYKETGLYVGQYVGSPEVWRWNHYPGTVGVVGPNAVANAEYAHFFASREDIFVFDGTRPVSIADGFVRQFYRDNIDPGTAYKTIVRYEKSSNLLWVLFPNVYTPTGYVGLVYHLGAKRWGKTYFPTNKAESVFEYRAPGSTVATKWLAFIDFSGNIGRYNVSSSPWTDATATLNVVGDDEQVSKLIQTYAAFTNINGTPRIATSTKEFRHSTPVEINPYLQYSNGKFDGMQTARWHSITLTLPNGGVTNGGVTEFTAYGFKFAPAGKR